MQRNEMDEDLGFQPLPQEQSVPMQEVPQEEQVVSEQPQTAQENNDVLSLNDEPTVETTTQEGLTPTVEVDRGAILNELFGTSDAETIKQQLAELAALKEQVTQPRYQSKFAEYVDSLVAKYGDPKTQADVFKKTIDILTTDVDALDPKTAIAFQMKQEYPTLSDEEIDLLVSGKYNLTDYATEEQQKLGAVQMKLDAQKAKLGIKQMQEEALKGAPDQKVLQKVDEEKRTLEWKQKSQDIAKSISSFEFEVEKGKKMRFDIPQSEYARLAATAEEIAVKSGFLPNETSMAQVQEFVKMAYIYENASKLVANAFKKGLSQANSEWAKQVHNPSGLRGTGVELGGRKKGENEYDEQDIVKWLEGR